MCVCLLVGAGLAFLLYQKSNKEIAKNIRYLLFALRFSCISFLCFFLLNPLLKNTSTYTEKPIVVIALDNSASIAKNKDSVFYKNNFLKEIHAFSEAISQKYEPLIVHFDAELKNNDSLTFLGKETNISNAFADIKNNFEGKNIGAVVLASDGLYNSGSNPLQEMQELNYPIYTIALGDTTIQKDALIKNANHNQTAYIGNRFPVEIQVQAASLQGKEATLSIYEEGKKINEQNIRYSSDTYTGIFNFLLEADKPGIRHYQAVLSLLSEEQIKTNNTYPFLVDVIDKREKIALLYEAPHPDVATLKQAIENNQSYEVVLFSTDNPPPSLKPYSLLMLHYISKNNPIAKQIQNEMALNKIPVWQFSKNDFWAFPSLQYSGTNNRYTDAEPIINKGFSLFSISNELKNYIKEMPAVSCMLSSFKVSNGAVALINQQIGQVQTENPILLFADNSIQKTALFCADGLWRWKLRDFSEHENNDIFNELIQKTVQYLSIKADKSFFRIFTKKIRNENESVEFDAEAFNPSYELINEPDVSMLITNEANKQFTYTFSKTSNAYRLNVGIFPAGSYSYTAQVKINNEVHQQKGEFTIKPLMVEFMSLAANHSLLYSISKKTGGELFYPSQLNQLQQKLLDNNSIKTLIHEQKQVNGFINIRWLFGLLLVLLSVEWFARKYSGLY